MADMSSSGIFSAEEQSDYAFNEGSNLFSRHPKGRFSTYNIQDVPRTLPTDVENDNNLQEKRKMLHIAKDAVQKIAQMKERNEARKQEKLKNLSNLTPTEPIDDEEESGAFDDHEPDEEDIENIPVDVPIAEDIDHDEGHDEMDRMSSSRRSSTRSRGSERLSGQGRLSGVDSPRWSRSTRESRASSQHVEVMAEDEPRSRNASRAGTSVNRSRNEFVALDEYVQPSPNRSQARRRSSSASQRVVEEEGALSRSRNGSRVEPEAQPESASPLLHVAEGNDHPETSMSRSLRTQHSRRDSAAAMNESQSRAEPSVHEDSVVPEEAPGIAAVNESRTRTRKSVEASARRESVASTEASRRDSTAPARKLKEPSVRREDLEPEEASRRDSTAANRSRVEPSAQRESIAPDVLPRRSNAAASRSRTETRKSVEPSANAEVVPPEPAPRKSSIPVVRSRTEARKSVDPSAQRESVAAEEPSRRSSTVGASRSRTEARKSVEPSAPRESVDPEEAPRRGSIAASRSRTDARKSAEPSTNRESLVPEEAPRRASTAASRSRTEARKSGDPSIRRESVAPEEAPIQTELRDAPEEPNARSYNLRRSAGADSSVAPPAVIEKSPAKDTPSRRLTRSRLSTAMTRQLEAADRDTGFQTSIEPPSCTPTRAQSRLAGRLDLNESLSSFTYNIKWKSTPVAPSGKIYQAKSVLGGKSVSEKQPVSPRRLNFISTVRDDAALSALSGTALSKHASKRVVADFGYTKSQVTVAESLCTQSIGHSTNSTNSLSSFSNRRMLLPKNDLICHIDEELRSDPSVDPTARFTLTRTGLRSAMRSGLRSQSSTMQLMGTTANASQRNATRSTAKTPDFEFVEPTLTASNVGGGDSYPASDSEDTPTPVNWKRTAAKRIRAAKPVSKTTTPVTARHERKESSPPRDVNQSPRSPLPPPPPPPPPPVAPAQPEQPVRATPSVQRLKRKSGPSPSRSSASAKRRKKLAETAENPKVVTENAVSATNGSTPQEQNDRFAVPAPPVVTAHANVGTSILSSARSVIDASISTQCTDYSVFGRPGLLPSRLDTVNEESVQNARRTTISTQTSAGSRRKRRMTHAQEQSKNAATNGPDIIPLNRFYNNHPPTPGLRRSQRTRIPHVSPHVGTLVTDQWGRLVGVKLNDWAKEFSGRVLCPNTTARKTKKGKQQSVLLAGKGRIRQRPPSSDSDEEISLKEHPSQEVHEDAADVHIGVSLSRQDEDDRPGVEHEQEQEHEPEFDPPQVMTPRRSILRRDMPLGPIEELEAQGTPRSAQSTRVSRRMSRRVSFALSSDPDISLDFVSPQVEQLADAPVVRPTRKSLGRRQSRREDTVLDYDEVVSSPEREEQQPVVEEPDDEEDEEVYEEEAEPEEEESEPVEEEDDAASESLHSTSDEEADNDLGLESPGISLDFVANTSTRKSMQQDGGEGSKSRRSSTASKEEGAANPTPARVSPASRRSSHSSRRSLASRHSAVEAVAADSTSVDRTEYDELLASRRSNIGTVWNDELHKMERREVYNQPDRLAYTAPKGDSSCYDFAVYSRNPTMGFIRMFPHKTKPRQISTNSMVFTLMEGQCEFELGNEHFALKQPHTIFSVPKGNHYSILNSSSQRCVLMYVF